MVVLIPTTTTCDANEFARLLFDRVFSKHGVPADLVSDRDTRFTSHYWEQLCERLQIHRSMSTAWHPQSDGSTEIVNKLVEQVCRAHINNRQDNWADRLSMVEFAINNAKHSATRYSPFFQISGDIPLLL
jgi:transposase InsO family protein